MQATIVANENFDSTVQYLCELFLEYDHKTLSEFSFHVFNKIIPDLTPSSTYASFQIVIRGEDLGLINVFPGEQNDSRIYINLHDPVIAPEEKYIGDTARIMYLKIKEIADQQEVDKFPKYSIHSYKKHDDLVDYLIVINNDEFLRMKRITRGIIFDICKHFGYEHSYIATEPWLIISDEEDREIVKLLWARKSDVEIATAISTPKKDVDEHTVSNRLSILRGVYKTNIVPTRKQLKEGFSPQY